MLRTYSIERSCQWPLFQMQSVGQWCAIIGVLRVLFFTLLDFYMHGMHNYAEGCIRGGSGPTSTGLIIAGFLFPFHI